jgi:hypothetical protein
MNETGSAPAGRWERWLPLGGILFSVLFIVGFAISGGDTGETDAEINAFYASGGHRGRAIATVFLLGAAVIFLLWFLTSLDRMLRPVSTTLANLALVSGIVYGVLLFAGVAAFSAYGAALEFSDNFRPDPNLARLIETFGFPLFAFAHAFGGITMIAASVVAKRARLLPTWWVWISVVLAVAAIATVILFVTFLAFALWVFIMGIALMMKQRRVAAP